MSDSLTKLGALAVTIESAGMDVCYEVAYPQEPNWPELHQTGLFPEHADPKAIVRVIESLFGKDCLPEISELVDQDWERSWLSELEPVQAGPNLWVCPSWVKPPVASAVNLTIDPGLAFGTGTHPTTALCLDWLDRNRPYNKEVVDYGCGSGILAIASLKLGAKHAWGIDIDPRALAASEDNARRNGVSDRYTVCPVEAIPKDFNADLVVANILANVLIGLRRSLTSLVCESGVILLTGILREQEVKVRKAYAPYFDLYQFRRGGWSMLVGYKG